MDNGKRNVRNVVPMMIVPVDLALRTFVKVHLHLQLKSQMVENVDQILIAKVETAVDVYLKGKLVFDYFINSQLSYYAYLHRCRECCDDDFCEALYGPSSAGQGVSWCCKRKACIKSQPGCP